MGGTLTRSNAEGFFLAREYNCTGTTVPCVMENSVQIKIGGRTWGQGFRGHEHCFTDKMLVEVLFGEKSSVGCSPQRYLLPTEKTAYGGTVFQTLLILVAECLSN